MERYLNQLIQEMERLTKRQEDLTDIVIFLRDELDTTRDKIRKINKKIEICKDLLGMPE